MLASLPSDKDSIAKEEATFSSSFSSEARGTKKGSAKPSSLWSGKCRSHEEMKYMRNLTEKGGKSVAAFGS